MRSCGLVLVLALIPFMAAAPAFAALEASTVDMGAELSHITYKEPGLMREDGVMYGIAATYTRFRNPGIKLDGRLSKGQVDYTGQYDDGTPLTVKNIQDTIIEFRAMISPVIPREQDIILPWIGLGYRYLFDGLDKTVGGYRRESNYLYLPIAVERMPYMTRSKNWAVGWMAEFDYLLRGRQVSHLSDVDPGYDDLENTQEKGWGVRGSLKFYRKWQQDLVIEPYVRYWRIAESNKEVITYMNLPVGLGWEPANSSTEFGVRLSFWF